MEKAQSVHHKSVYFENEERHKGKRKSKKGETPRSETNLGKVWEVTPSPFAIGVELAMCQCCSRRTAENDGGDDEDTVGSAGKRRQMGGGDSTKVETAKRRRLD